MTREEAIQYLNKLYTRAELTDVYGDMEDMTPYEEALVMAINVLGAIEQIQWERDAAIAQLKDLGYALGEKVEPCEDVISRQAVLNLPKKTLHDYFGETVGDVVWIDDIIRLPSVNSTKTGHWINIEDRTDWYDATYKCSCCGREIMTPYELKNNLYGDYPYCHCGAKMTESEDK